MRILSLVLIAFAAIAGNASAQTATPPPATAPAASAAPAQASAPASSASSSSSVSHDCKKEARKLCGMAHGSDMQGCIKSNLDLNKFSANCATEFKNAAAAKKPAS